MKISTDKVKAEFLIKEKVSTSFTFLHGPLVWVPQDPSVKRLRHADLLVAPA
jgi:hypothetical protein